MIKVLSAVLELTPFLLCAPLLINKAFHDEPVSCCCVTSSPSLFPTCYSLLPKHLQLFPPKDLAPAVFFSIMSSRSSSISPAVWPFSSRPFLQYRRVLNMKYPLLSVSICLTVCVCQSVCLCHSLSYVCMYICMYVICHAVT